MSAITSRDNPRVRHWRALTRDTRERRRHNRVLIEGAHLVEAYLGSGRKVEELILCKSKAPAFDALAKRTGKPAVVLPNAVFDAIVDSESPSGVAAEIEISRSAADLGNAASCLFLEGIQDAGNVGAILRSAAAFGVRHAVLGKGCADAWSPKVLRAGMGAHFVIDILEGADLVAAVGRFGGTVASTVARGGTALKDADLSGRVGWVFGAEGQGVSTALAARTQLRITIPMPGGTESLNVAAAAAICLYELSRRGAPA